MTQKLRVREVGPREGLQTSSAVVPTGDKLELIELLGRTGVGEIEITSFVKPERVPQMADAQEVVRQFRAEPGVRYSALYLNHKGFELAEAAGRVQNEAWVHLAASETFFKKNSNRSIAEGIQELPAWVELFKKHNKQGVHLMLSTAFGCSYEGPVPHSKVLQVIEDVHDGLAKSGSELIEICLADTMGWGTPDKVRRLVAAVKNRWPKVDVTLHLHDTRGTGVANVYAGILEGVTCFDASVGGVGGCPFAKGAAGNVATEDVVFMLHEMGYETGINLAAYAEAARFAERILQAGPLPGRYYKTLNKA